MDNKIIDITKYFNKRINNIISLENELNFLKSDEYKNALELNKIGKINVLDEIVMDLIDFNDYIEQIGSYENFDDYIYWPYDKLNNTKQSIGMHAAKFLTEKLHKRNQLTDKIYLTVLYIAFKTSNMYASLVTRYIRKTELIDGINEIEIDIPNCYITENLEVINTRNLENKRIKEVSSLIELIQKENPKEPGTITVIKLSNIRVKEIKENFTLEEIERFKIAKEVIKEHNNIKEIIDDLLRVVYTYELTQNLKELLPESNIGLVAFTDSEKIKVKINFDKELYSKKHPGRIK